MRNVILPFKMTLRKPLASSLVKSLLIILLMNVFRGLTLTCHRTEYLIGNECCPMCPAGSRVKTHCTEIRSTSCLLCVEGTFTIQPNGLQQCFPCRNCDAGSGLKIKTQCTTTSDTVCEPLDGFYCFDPPEDPCVVARKHRHCPPGTFIHQKGTAESDTECSACSDGTFSNGSLTSCQPHTRCESKNLQQITPGNDSVDAQCGEKPSATSGIVIGVGVVVGVGVAILAIVMMIYWNIIIKKKRFPCTERNRNAENGKTDGHQGEGQRMMPYDQQQGASQSLEAKPPGTAPTIEAELTQWPNRNIPISASVT